MEKNSSNQGNTAESATVPFLKTYVFHNWGLKIIAVLFAFLIWGVVLATTNPTREKSITGVTLTAINDDLAAKGLVIRGTPIAAREPVSVRINTPIANYSDISAKDIRARIDLSTITTTGVMRLDVMPQFSMITVPEGAEVLSVTPAQIEVEIDELIPKTVQLRVYHGDTVLPKDYWHGDAVIEIGNTIVNQIEITGPKQDVDQVDQAVCYIPLNRTEPLDDPNVPIVFWDKEEKELDASVFERGVRTAHVTMDVKPKKNVPINIADSINGVPANNYEIVDSSSSPAYVDIIGDADRLNDIKELYVNTLDVTGATTSINDMYDLTIPRDIQVIGGITQVNVFVEISEEVIERTFDSIPITTRGLDNNLVPTLSRDTTDITITGRKSVVELLERSDIQVYVDLEGRTEGEVDLDLIVYFIDDDTTLELRDGTVSTVKQIRVTLNKK